MLPSLTSSQYQWWEQGKNQYLRLLKQSRADSQHQVMFATANLPAKIGKAHLINTLGYETQHIWGRSADSEGKRGGQMAQTGTYWKMSARTDFLQKTGPLTTVLFAQTALSAAQEVSSQKTSLKVKVCCRGGRLMCLSPC